MHFDCHVSPAPSGLLQGARDLLDDSLHALVRQPFRGPARRILVLGPQSPGRTAILIPMLARLRQGCPEARVDVVTSAEASRLLPHPSLDVGERPLVDQVWVTHSRWPEAGPCPLARMLVPLQLLLDPLVRRLRGRKYDIVIDCVGRKRHALLSLLVGARYRAGFAAGLGSFLYHHRVQAPVGRLCGDSALDLLEPLGLALPARSTPMSHGRVAPAHVVDGDPGAVEQIPAAGGVHADDSHEGSPRAARLHAGGAGTPGDRVVRAVRGHGPRHVGLYVGHDGVAANRWRVDHWAELVRLLHEAGSGEITVVKGVRDDSTVEGMRDALSDAGAPWASVRAAAVDDLVDVLGTLDVLVCVESDAMLVADALGIPVVAVFGGQDPLLWGPGGPHSRVVRALEGAACLERGRCVTAQCINAVTPARVAGMVKSVLRDLAEKTEAGS